MKMAIVSKEKSIRKEDVLKWGRNALIFAAPALLVLLASFRELIPMEAVWGVLALYILNLVTDFFRKWLNQNKY